MNVSFYLDRYFRITLLINGRSIFLKVNVLQKNDFCHDHPSCNLYYFLLVFENNQGIERCRQKLVEVDVKVITFLW